MAGPIVSIEGGRIDRSSAAEHLRSTARNTPVIAGDTLASALLANDVSLVSRSFKLHRPRGIVGAGAEEPNAIVQIGKGAATIPNLRATQVELYDGLVPARAKAGPGLRTSTSAPSMIASADCSAPGFTTRPSCGRKRCGNHYERFIRASAGFGNVAPPRRSRSPTITAMHIATFSLQAAVRPA